VSTYIPACRDEIACTALPNGSEHYAQNLRVHTSTDLTAQQIHDLGLRCAQWPLRACHVAPGIRAVRC
jgi:uncharacterized protein (DUF885 family)